LDRYGRVVQPETAAVSGNFRKRSTGLWTGVWVGDASAKRSLGAHDGFTEQPLGGVTFIGIAALISVLEVVVGQNTRDDDTPAG